MSGMTPLVRVRNAERARIATPEGLLQDLSCDGVNIMCTDAGLVLQFYDLWGGKPQRLKESPRLISTVRIVGTARLEDDVLFGNYTITSEGGLAVCIKPALGANLRIEDPSIESGGRSVVVSKLREMHAGIAELERQIDSVSHVEARARLEDALGRLRRDTSAMERFLSGTIIATEGPERGRGTQPKGGV